MGSSDDQKTREAAGDEDPTTDFSVVTGSRSSDPPARRSPEGAATSELPANFVIAGRYRLLRKLGQGGFGVVYAAVDQQLNRRVAVKCHLQLFHRSAEVLRDEARAIAALHHPGIVGVHDLLEDEAVGLAIVMEYVEGVDLRHRLQRSRPSPYQAAVLVRQVCDALAHAHSRGLVHRDLKPSNVLVDSEGRLRLTDFGLAVGLPRQAAIEAAGTPRYMAPEQLRNELHRIDGRTDLWGVGVLFYEMLAGVLPFGGSDRQTLFQNTLWNDPIPPRQLNPRIPERLEQICLKCLRKRMVDRYQSAAALLDELDDWLQTASDEGAAGPLPAAAIGADAKTPRPQSTVDAFRPLTIVPKGLRPFEETDSDFFIELLPGPRHRSGLPESVVFWKSWIEGSGDEPEDRVGVLYGPSGAGKSSFLRAAVIPHLDMDICPLYVECRHGRTEPRIQRAIETRLGLPAEGRTLQELMADVREKVTVASGYRKVVLILDQFESWCSAASLEARQALAEAVRQCDGRRVQCLIGVRDDFWMGVTEFAQWVETPLLEGRNTAALDLLDRQHARRVLIAMGHAYGALSETADALSPAEQDFIERAIEELAEEDHVISVHLAMFALMVRSRQWSPSLLAAEGGASGATVEFLQQNFDRRTAPPGYRPLREPVAVTLSRLLPPLDSSVTGQLVSRSELAAHLELHGFAGRLPDVLNVLSEELKLITPAQVESSSGGAKAEMHYQLAHDFLVRPVRQWVDTVQQSTWQGRATARLAELSRIWNKHPSRQWYPTVGEYVAMRLGSRRAGRTPAQERFLRAAGRYHAGRISAGLIGLLVAVIMTGVAIHQRSEAVAARDNERAALVDLALHGPAEDFGQHAESLSQTPAEAAELIAPWTDSVDPELQLRARLLLAVLGRTDAEALVATLGESPPQLFTFYREVFQTSPRYREMLLAEFQDAPTSESEMRAAMLLLELGVPGPAESLLTFADDGFVRHRATAEAARWHGAPEPWLKLAAGTGEPTVRHAAYGVIGSMPEEQARAAVDIGVIEEMISSPEAIWHSLGGWLATILDLEITRDAEAPAGANWRQTPTGLTLIRIPAGGLQHGFGIERTSHIMRTATNPQETWISDSQITRGLYLRFLTDSGAAGDTPTNNPFILDAIEENPDRPVEGISIEDAIRFCNWLSEREGLQPAYQLIDAAEGRGDDDLESASWTFAGDKSGYRLPSGGTLAFAALAGNTRGRPWWTADAIWRGNRPDRQDRLISVERPREVREMWPNGFGFFMPQHGVASYVLDGSLNPADEVTYVGFGETGIFFMDRAQHERRLSGFYVVLPVQQ